MKTLFLLSVSALLICGSGTAGEMLIPVDFGAVGSANISNTCLSSAGSFGAIINGVDFCYSAPLIIDAAGGIVPDPSQTAFVSGTGIFGTTGGLLGAFFTPAFPYPVTSLHFDFLYSPAVIGDVGLPLNVFLYDNLGAFVDFGTGATNAFNAGGGGSPYVSGNFNYSGMAFTRADVVFDSTLANFNISNFSYDVATPEPGTMALLGSALLGLAALYRRRRT